MFYFSRPTSEDIGEIIDLLQAKRINLQTAETVLEAVAREEQPSVTHMVTARDLWLVTDAAQVQAVCKTAVQRNPQLVQAYRDGKTKVLFALLGIIAKETNNRVDMSLVTKQLQEMLKKP